MTPEAMAADASGALAAGTNMTLVRRKGQKMPPSLGRWKERSRTYSGVAEAMAAQWGLAPNDKAQRPASSGSDGATC